MKNQRNWQHKIHKTKKNKAETQNNTYTNTNNVNKTWALLQRAEGKNEPNIVLCENRNGHHNTELRT